MIEINRELYFLCADTAQGTTWSMHQPNSGEAVSFENQFKLHFKLLCAVAFYIVNDEDAARDIVQDFFLYCWKKRHHIQITHDFKRYAVRAIRNASLNYIKKSSKTTLEEVGVIEQLSKNFPGEELEQDDQRNKALWEAISRLPEQRRKIFLLSNQDDLKYKDIAVKLDISINTVKTQIKLALLFLRRECSWMVKVMACLFFFKQW